MFRSFRIALKFGVAVAQSEQESEKKLATITKRFKKWRVEIRQKHNRYISKTFVSKGHASQWAKETERKLEKEQYEDFRDSAHISLGHLIIRYRDEITPSKKSTQNETYKLNFLLRHPIARCKILKLTSRKVIEFKKDISIGRKPATINKYLHYIYTIWETARINWGITLPTGNPTALVKREKVMTKIDRILTEDEYNRLIEASRKSNYEQLTDMIEFAYITAMRFGEITKLQVKDIDFDNSTAKLIDTKNGETDVVPLPQRALDICDKYKFKDKVIKLETSQALFPIYRDKFRHYFEQACQRAGVEDFRFHDLRACAITNLFKKGWQIAEVSVVSGHKSWSELKKYTRIKPIDLVKKINEKE